MSADQVSTGFRCYCLHCMGQASEDTAAEGRYTIPNGPGIPNPPKIPVGPGIPDSTTPSSPTTPSGTETDPAGYTGPRFHTLLWGAPYWNGTTTGVPAVVQYSFATRSLSNYATGTGSARAGFIPGESEPLDVNQRSGIKEALKLWEEVSGLFFIEVPDQPEQAFSGIRFSMQNLDTYGIPGLVGLSLPNAWLPVPSGTYGFNVQFSMKAYGDDPLLMGTDAFLTAMHEIGHAIGLQHPFDRSPRLSASDDNTNNTVMSYTDGGNLTHLGPYDIDAVRHIYGTQQAEERAPVRWAHGPGGSLVTTGDDTGNAITGLVIRDIVRGNGGDDRIETLGGDDEITPGAGNDVVFGGAGRDVLDTGFLRAQAEVRSGAIQGTVALPDGLDTFYQVETIRFVDGDLVFGAGSAAGQMHRLYGAVLGRAPDPIGLGHWVSALDAGAISLSGAASGLMKSAEFAARYGAPSAEGFVSLLYQNVLGRAPDQAGLDHWLKAAQNPAVDRAGLLLGFSDSAENQSRTANAFVGGVWVPDPDAVDVMRAYVAVLDRLPDAAGLAHWTAARKGGFGQFDLIHGFVSSSEFQARFGGLSNRDFVEQLYRTALDRPGDARGVDVWTHVLDAGIDSRTGVAFGFANSVEVTDKLTPVVGDGLLLA